ncbi:MAG: TlpA disulfide reductase family protein [Verrucomicrobiota bacterium]
MREKWSLLAAGVIFAAAALTLRPAPAHAQQRELAPEMKALLSRLESMGHGYHSDAEWQVLFGEIGRLAQNARQAGDWNALVDVTVIEAMVYSDMRGDHKKAVSILEKARKEFAGTKASNMPKVYVREAEVYSRLGDEAAISRLISEFRASRFYDPENYSYSGGLGRDVPLKIVRPSGRGDDSVSVSAMEMYRNQARFAGGRAFPDFEAVTSQGAPLRLSDYRGKVVLLDFWLMGWEPWKRNLGTLGQAYRRYGASGFEIIGINLDPAPSGLNEFLQAYNMTWPQVVGDKALPRKLGIFGEATSFLVDRDGMIIGRDLKGADLVAAVKRALGIE